MHTLWRYNNVILLYCFIIVKYYNIIVIYDTVIYNIIIVLFYCSYNRHDFFVCVFLIWDFLCFGILGFYIGGFYNRKSVRRVMRERSFTKKPPILTVPYFTIYQSMETTNTCSSAQQYRTNKKPL